MKNYWVLFLLLMCWIAHFISPLSYALATTGDHVFRGAVSPRPKVQTQSPPVTEQKPAQAVTKTGTKKQSKTSAAKLSKKTNPSKVKSGSATSKEQKASVSASPKKTTKGSAQGGKQASQAKAPAKSVSTPAKTSNIKKKENSKKHPKSDHKDLQLNVRAAFLVNMNTGQVYYEYNADQAMAPASLTKLLTLYLINEALASGKVSRDTLIPVSAQAVRTGGSRMSLKSGEKVPLSELVNGISVVSANNACVAVAEYLTQGNPAKFIAQMNRKAKAIGMTKSIFKNSNGLPATGQVSTARDIAKLSMSYLRSFPESLKTHSMTTHTYHGTTHNNANSLLRTYKGVDGLKTGFVSASGYSITATAKRGNTRLVAVVLGAPNAIVRQVETTKLLDYGFKKVTADKGLGARAEGQKKKKGV